MTAISISTCFICLILLIFHFEFLSAGQSSSFSFQSFSKDPNFALYGDARVVNNGSVLQLTHSASSGAGRVMYKKPIKLVEGNPEYLVSFSSYLSFLMSPDYGDRLAFFMVSGGFNFSEFGTSSPFGASSRSMENNSKFVAVELDAKMDVKFGDLNDNHVGINVGGFTSVKVENASSVSLVLSNGTKLSCWIDYEASSKRLEVRLSKFGNTKPIDPLLSRPIDLPKLWKDEKLYIGLSSSNGNSTHYKACLIYSWSFAQRHVPHWMHSQPLDPEAFVEDVKPVGINKPSNCLLRVVAALIFGAACGALGAFIMLNLWTIFGSRRPVVPEECSSIHPVDFDYKKVKVVVEKAVEDGKN